MRCQKVRSYLSAYCNDEVTGSMKLAIDNHLSNCSDCRKDEVVYHSLNTNVNELSSLKVSDEFNNKLLNRIAHERFAETRTAAYLPKKAPLFSWAKAIPAVASAFLVVFIGISLTLNQLNQPAPSNTMLASNNGQDDSYLYAQPDNNPNMIVNMNKDWSFNEQLARSERMNQISRNLSSAGDFVQNVAFSQGSKYHKHALVPYSGTYHKQKPILKIYVYPSNSTVKEASEDY